jgi:hypothetical protein
VGNARTCPPSRDVGQILQDGFEFEFGTLSFTAYIGGQVLFIHGR